jgi:alkanesulfonate monooxygenase
MYCLRELLDGESLDFHGEFLDLTIDPPGARTVSGRSPLFYFGGLSPAARECAAAGADVFLMWPDTTDKVLTVKADMDARAAAKGRTLRYGWRSHVIVRETEDEARAAARRLLSKLDPDEGEAIRKKSLDSASAGVANQARCARARRRGLRRAPPLDRRRSGPSGAGAAIVGDPDQVLGKINELIDAGIDCVHPVRLPARRRVRPVRPARPAPHRSRHGHPDRHRRHVRPPRRGPVDRVSAIATSASGSA